MHAPAHELRKKLADGRPVLGTFLVEMVGPAVVNALADAGFDFIMIDTEHGNQDQTEIATMIEVGYQAGICMLMRPPSGQRDLITKCLDAGAGGVLVPAISTMAQVQQVVQVTKYSPIGKRGVHLFRGHTRHRPVDAPSFLEQANADLFTLIQIELAAALEIVDQIAATQGVDGLYIGPGDLAVDLGVPGQWNNPKLHEAFRTVAAACKRHGKILACHADFVKDMPMLRQIGVQMFGYFCDIGVFKNAYTAVADEFKQTMEIQS
jgi:4-hydroxy-2-oxoheptanedioate aldolase